MKYRLSAKGFTLLEMMLVLVIAASLMAMFINFTTQQYHQQQRDKVVLQMQQILNAALSYYNQKGIWPGTGNTWVSLNASNDLISSGYLAAGTGSNSAWISPYNSGSYQIGFNSTTNVFFVAATMIGGASENLDPNARVIAAQLPSGAVVPGAVSAIPPTSGTCAIGGTCVAVASVSPPGQNLNNARSVNFGSVYSSGQCVPTPTCPAGMTAQIFVVPVSVNGLGNGTTDMQNSANPNVYPISSYTAFALGPFLGTANNNSCSTGTNDDCSKVQGGAGGMYWRVCLSITTQKGPTVVPSANQTDTKNLGNLIAVTRCVPGSPPSEQVGSQFQVYQ